MLCHVDCCSLDIETAPDPPHRPTSTSFIHCDVNALPSGIVQIIYVIWYSLQIFRDFLGCQRYAIATGAPLPSFDVSAESCAPTDSASDQTPPSHSSIPEEFYPVHVNVNPTESPVENLRQFYLFLPSNVKVPYLVHLLSTEFKDQSGLIFTKTCQYVIKQFPVLGTRVA